MHVFKYWSFILIYVSIDGKLPVNNQISYNLQDIFNLLPNLNIEELVKSMLIKTNDLYLVIYLSSLIRSIIALHNLLSNKIKYKDLDSILDKSAGVEVAKEESKGEKKEESKEDKKLSSPTPNKQ